EKSVAIQDVASEQSSRFVRVTHDLDQAERQGVDAQQNVLNGHPLDGSTDAADIELADFARVQFFGNGQESTRRRWPPNRAGRARREFPRRYADDGGQAVRTGRVGEAEC